MLNKSFLISSKDGSIQFVEDFYIGLEYEEYCFQFDGNDYNGITVCEERNQQLLQDITLMKEELKKNKRYVHKTFYNL